MGATALVALSPGELGDVAQLHRELGLGDTARLERVLRQGANSGWGLEVGGRLRAYATVTAWMRREDTVGVRLVAAPEVDPAGLALLLGPVLAADCPRGVLVYPVSVEWAPALAGLGLDPVEEITAYERAPGPLPEARPAGEVRHFDPGDVHAVLAVEHSAFPPLWWMSGADFLEVSALARTTFLVGVWGGTVVAYCTTHSGAGHSVHVGRLGVSRAHQGRGIGSWLLYQALVPLCDRVVGLNTQTGNTASRRLYEKFGFVATGRHLIIGRGVETPPAR